jgi:hypothetical protein
MTTSHPSARLRRIIAILTATVFSFGAMQAAAFAKNHNKSGDHGNMNSGMKSGKSESKKHKSNDKSAEKKKHKDKDKEAKKGKDKDKGKTAEKEKTPVIISGGYVRDKLPNGTVYYRRATRDELEKAAKANGGATAGTTPPPAAPAGDGPVVRDHRQGSTGSAYNVPAGTAPGTIIRDHRTGADGTPMIVVKDRAGTLVTRKATEAELEKAGFKKPAPPAAVEVPIGALGGGR